MPPPLLGASVGCTSACSESPRGRAVASVAGARLVVREAPRKERTSMKAVPEIARDGHERRLSRLAGLAARSEPRHGEPTATTFS